MALVKKCHQQARELSSQVMTTIRIEDEEGATDKLNENIASVERAAGRRLRRCWKSGGGRDADHSPQSL